MVSQVSNTPLPVIDKSPMGKPKVKKSLGQTPYVVALIAVLLGVGVTRSVFFSKPAEEATTMIVVAGRDIAPGYRIGFQDVHYSKLPKQYFVKGMARTYAEVVGSISKTYVSKTEPILTGRLAALNSPFSTTVGVAGRAISLKLQDESLVDHMVSIGDRVDVIATTAGKNGRKYTRTIVQNALVLLANPKEMAQSDKLKSDSNKITLQVLPHDAEVLSEAVEESKLSIALRNPQNKLVQPMMGADIRDLLPHEALREAVPESTHEVAQPPAPPVSALPLPLPSSIQLPPPVEAPIKWAVQIFKGATKETHEVDR